MLKFKLLSAAYILSFITVLSSNIGYAYDNYSINNCNTIKDEISQTNYYHKTALIKIQQGGGRILMPVGHFTSYISAEIGEKISRKRINLLSTQLSEGNCSQPSIKGASIKTQFPQEIDINTTQNNIRNSVYEIPPTIHTNMTTSFGA